MAELIEEVAAVVEPVESEPAPTQAIDLDALVGEDEAAAVATAEETGDAFIGGYTPAPAADTPLSPEIADPRVAWRKKNADQLKAKDKEEADAKKKLHDSASAHLKKVLEQRSKVLSSRKDTNRAAARVNTDTGVPKEGTTWEKVSALVNFTAGTHQKDVTRFKTTLTTLKTQKAN